VAVFRAIDGSFTLTAQSNGAPCAHEFPEGEDVEIPDTPEHKLCVKGARRSSALEEV